MAISNFRFCSELYNLILFLFLVLFQSKLLFFSSFHFCSLNQFRALVKNKCYAHYFCENFEWTLNFWTVVQKNVSWFLCCTEVLCTLMYIRICMYSIYIYIIPCTQPYVLGLHFLLFFIIYNIPQLPCSKSGSRALSGTAAVTSKKKASSFNQRLLHSSSLLYNLLSPCITAYSVTVSECYNIEKA